MQRLYFHPRGEHGEILPRLVTDDEAPDDRELMMRRWRERYCLSEEQAAAKWTEFMRCEDYRAHLEQQPGADPEKINAAVREFERRLWRER